MGKHYFFKLIIVSAAIIFMHTAQAQTVTVGGKYIYHNDSQSPLGNVNVTLINQTNQVVATTTTDVNGIYTFTNVTAGNYTIKASSNQPSRGYTIKDCLSLLMYTKGFLSLDNIQLLAADVDNNNVVDKNDLKLMLANWANSSAIFPAGNWKFQTVHFTVNATKGAAPVDGVRISHCLPQAELLQVTWVQSTCLEVNRLLPLI